MPRYCSHRDDPGYESFQAALIEGKVPVVLVNGVIVNDVVVADEEAGFVKVFRRDPEGDLIVDSRRGCPVTERLYGHVGVVLMENR